jgi:hypothetical protein
MLTTLQDSSATQGAGVYVDGALASETGPLDPSAAVVIENGAVRLSRVGSPAQRAGILAEVLVGESWVPATSPVYGDWTFVDQSVVTEPTEIHVISAGPEVAAVRWVFGAHLTGPPSAPLSYPYPFVKTVWLLAGDSGFFTQITPLVALPPEQWYAPGVSEHEVGFGGVWGPGSVSTWSGTVVTAELPGHYEFNTIPRVDAAHFTREGDPLTRVLIPLSEGPLLVPVFDEVTRGSVFVHHYQPRTYGAYLYAAPSASAVSTRTLCAYAWLTAPFTVGPLEPGELETCGPDPAVEGPTTTTTSTSSTSTSSSTTSSSTTSSSSTSRSTTSSSSTSTSSSSTTTSTVPGRRRRPNQ